MFSKSIGKAKIGKANAHSYRNNSPKSLLHIHAPRIAFSELPRGGDPTSEKKPCLLRFTSAGKKRLEPITGFCFSQF